MIVYWFLFAWTLMLSVYYIRYQKTVLVYGLVEYRTQLSHVLLVGTPLIVMAGFRWRGVVDTGGYINAFDSAPRLNELMITDPSSAGFRLLESTFKTFFSADPQMWLLFLAFATSSAILFRLYKHSPLFGLSVFLWLGTTQFTWLFNGVRQYLVVALVFMLLPLIINRRFFTFMLCVAALFTVHNSVLIMIPAYFVAMYDPWKKQFYFSAGLIIVMIVFLNYFLDLANFFFYETEYEEVFQRALQQDGINALRTLAAAVPVAISFLYRRQIWRKGTPLVKLSVNMSLIALGVYAVATVIGGNYFGRFAAYFNIYWLILYPWVALHCVNRKNRRFFIFGVVVFYTLWFYIDMGDYPYISEFFNLNFPGSGAE